MIALDCDVGTDLNRLSGCWMSRFRQKWATDPDGVQWEVYYFHEDAEFNDPHYEMKDASACCMPPVAEKPKLKIAEIQSANSCTPGSGCC